MRAAARTAGLWAVVLAAAAGARPASAPPQTASPASAEPAWSAANSHHLWRWPRELYACHQFKTEWWYVTGHLWPSGAAAPADSTLLPFQATFFRLGAIPPGAPLPEAALAAPGGMMAHAALADPAHRRRIFSEVLWRQTPLLAGCGAPGDTTVVWCRAPGGTDGRWRLGFDGDRITLSARDDRQGLLLDLICRPLKPVVLHGDNGFSAKSPDGLGGSLYASLTRMEASGTVLRDGRALPVSGICWLDREMFTHSLSSGQDGWDWISLQLQDGREVMLYRLFGRDPAALRASGTLVAPDGSASPLGPGDWTLQERDPWTSPATGARYPLRWRLQVPQAGLDVELRAVMADQENRGARSGLHYWEGAVTVHRSGDPGADRIGLGFVEMVGRDPQGLPPVLR